jgi:hypothetical protein
MEVRTMESPATFALAARDRWQERFEEELRAMGLPRSGPPDAHDPVTDADLAHLPVTAQRYMRFMRVVGRPRDWSFRLQWIGRFRRSPTDDWRLIQAVQYDTSPAIARVFHMRMRFGGLPLIARDVYLGGEGHMVARIAGLFTVADGRGEAFDTGELVTYLNDCVFFAPSMLLRPSIRWGHVDDSSFDLALTDAGRTVKARVWLDARDAPRDFSTTDRFVELDEHGHPGSPVRTRWSTPIDGWDLTDQHPRAEHGMAIWHLPQGPFPYADFTTQPGSLIFNTPPG